MDNTDNEMYSALLEIIKQESSPEAVKARNLILRRIAMTGDVTPSRIQQTQNITQIGGYINLLASIQQEGIRNRMLASVLGVAAPGEEYVLRDDQPELFFARRTSDRPECEQMETLPLYFYMRSDFGEAFEGALAALHTVGATLPVLQTATPSLPPLSAPLPTPEGILALLGRIIELAPTAVFQNPEQDPLVVAQQDETAIVYARSNSGQELSAVKAYVWEDGGYVVKEISGKFISIAPLLQVAGWYMVKRAPEQQETDFVPASALRWRNITGLVPGRTTLASELSLLYPRAQIVDSCLREMLDARWDGAKFA